MTTIKNIAYLIGLVLVLVIFSIRAEALETIGEAEIRPGMKGYGLTVFEGVRPERFNVEVVSVVPNFLLRQSIILVRCDHPVTDRAGIIGGMSGSPIFIEGRLAGALAYGWQFTTEPIAGVTPVRNMLEVMTRKLRGSTHIFRKKGAQLIGIENRSPAKSSLYGARFFDNFKEGRGDQLLPARTPLSLGGFLSSARAVLEEALGPFGIDPVAGGGGAGNSDGPTKFENGASIGVQLIRGDMSATAIGTVTLVDGSNVLAFGHPMFNMGEGYFPVTTARIHTVISSILRSNKIGSPLNVVGSLVQDRTACILARTDRTAQMIPVSIKVRDPRGNRVDIYKVEIASHRLLTPRFLQAALINVITDTAADLEDVTAEITGDLKISGRPLLRLYDSGASRSGLASLASYFKPVAMVAAVLDNQFEDVTVDALDFDITLHYGLDFATVEAVYVTAVEPEPGEIINVHVRLSKYDDSDQILSIPVQIPTTAAGEIIQIEVAGGEFATPVMPAPRNLDDALNNILRLYPAKSIVVNLNVPGEGISMRGHYLEQLPRSVINTLRPVAGIDQIEPHRNVLTKVTQTRYLVAGQESFRLKVGGRRNR